MSVVKVNTKFFFAILHYIVYASHADKTLMKQLFIYEYVSNDLFYAEEPLVLLSKFLM